MIWYAAWCLADGSIRAEAHESFDSAIDAYSANPHRFTTSELSLCQWRGVFSQKELAKNIGRIE